MPQQQANNEILRRGGDPTIQYIVEFGRFLYVRTGFRFTNFVSPAHLQRLLDELSFNRVPMTVWHGIMESALRIANMSRTIGHSLRTFGAFFIDVLVWLVRRLVRIGLLNLTIFLFNWTISPLARGAITLLYYAIDWFLGPLWESFSTFVQSRLITAPYYTHFLTMQ